MSTASPPASSPSAIPAPSSCRSSAGVFGTSPAGPWRRSFRSASARSSSSALHPRSCCAKSNGRRAFCMGDSYGTVKVAAVQAASVFLDREGSTEKACRLIREAGKQGARVIGFPEGYIPAHPVWYHHHAATGTLANRLATELFKNSVEIPGSEIDALASAARDANAYVVVGVCEKIPNTIGTMFNTQ